MTRDVKDMYRWLDQMAKYGDPSEQELATHLIHEIDDFFGRSDRKRADSTKVLPDTPSATST